MAYAERTGAGCQVMFSDGTIGYQYFKPIDLETRHEQNVMQSIGAGLSIGHSVVPIKEHTDPLGGGNNRYTTRPGPQFFSGSDGGGFESYGGRVTRPAPIGQYRGKPLENPPTPRPPHTQCVDCQISV